MTVLLRNKEDLYNLLAYVGKSIEEVVGIQTTAKDAIKMLDDYYDELKGEVFILQTPRHIVIGNERIAEYATVLNYIEFLTALRELEYDVAVHSHNSAYSFKCYAPIVVLMPKWFIDSHFQYSICN